MSVSRPPLRDTRPQQRDAKPPPDDPAILNRMLQRRGLASTLFLLSETELANDLGFKTVLLGLSRVCARIERFKKP